MKEKGCYRTEAEVDKVIHDRNSQGCIHAQVRFVGEFADTRVFRCVACGFEYAEVVK